MNLPHVPNIVIKDEPYIRAQLNEFNGNRELPPGMRNERFRLG